MSNVSNTPGAVRPAAPVPQAAPPKKESRGLLSHVGDFFLGAGESVVDVAKGVLTMVTHPIQTVKGIGYAVTHPAELVKAFTDPYTEAMAEGRPGKALGRGLVEIGSLFITGGGSAAAKGASGAGKLAQLANASGKAGKLAQVAAVAGKGGKVAAAAGKAGQAANAAGKAGKLAQAGSKLVKLAKAPFVAKPVMTKAAQAATKAAGISDDVARAANAAARAEYVAAKAAGKSAQAAKLAARAKAAEVMGITIKGGKVMGGAKNVAAVEKVVNSARISGAAAQSAEIASKVTISQRLSKAAAAARGLPRNVINGVRTKGAAAVTAAKDTAVASAKRLGTLADDIGKVTLKDIAVAPFKATARVYGSARSVVSSAWTKLRGGAKAADAAGDAAKAAKAAEAAQAAGRFGRVGAVATKAGGVLKAVVTAPFKAAKFAMSKTWQAGKYLYTHPRLWTPLNLASRAALPTIMASYGEGKLTDQQVDEIAKQFKLKPGRENVEKFLKEIQGYQGAAIGPDSGTPEEVQQLKTVLNALGYKDVDPANPEFDEATANAVMDFKGQKGLFQTYEQADYDEAGNVIPGSEKPGLNEYVDEATAQALVDTLKGGQTMTPGAEPASAGETVNPTPAKPGESPAANPAAPGAPAAGQPYKTYTVGNMDRATGLSGIARHYLGDASRWKEIYELNKDLIGDNPNLVIAGQKLRMPADAKGLPVERGATPPPAAPAPAAPAPAAPAPAAPAPAAPAPAAPAPAEPAAELSETGKKLAADYGLQADAANVAAFVEETKTYKANAIGPEAGSADDINKVREILIALGYTKVAKTGAWDDTMSTAVMEFKAKHGLHQTYKLADGTWALNEYVDEGTANKMASLLEGK